MNTYKVKTFKAYCQYVTVDADSPESAIEKVDKGEGEPYGELEFIDMLDNWDTDPEVDVELMET